MLVACRVCFFTFISVCFVSCLFSFLSVFVSVVCLSVCLSVIFLLVCLLCFFCYFLFVLLPIRFLVCCLFVSSFSYCSLVYLLILVILFFRLCVCLSVCGSDLRGRHRS